MTRTAPAKSAGLKLGQVESAGRDDAESQIDDYADRDSRRRIPSVIWMICVAALLIRVAAVLVIGSKQMAPNAVNAAEHKSLAMSLLAGDGFSFNEAAEYTETGVYEPSSVQSPPYPLLLAGLYWSFGYDASAANPSENISAMTRAHATAMLLNAFAGAAAIPLLFVMVRRFGGHPVVAIAAAAVFAFWPTQIYSVIAVQVIALLTLATIAITVLWYVSLDSGKLWPWVLFSVIGAVAALAEPVYLPAMFVAGCAMLLRRRFPINLKLRNGLILFTATVCIIGPWTYRNWLVHEKFMPIKSTVWVNIWKANNPNSSGTDRPRLTAENKQRYLELGTDELRQYDFLSDEQRIELAGLRTADREDVWKHYAQTWIKENPSDYVKLAGTRVAKTLWWDWDNPKGHQQFYLYPISRGILLAGTVLGLYVAWRRRWRLGMPAIIAGTSLFVYALTITAARFAFPLEPFQIALLAAAMFGLFVSDRVGDRPPIVTRWLAGRGHNRGDR